MTDLIAALRDKIAALVDEKEELEDALARIESKIQVFEEIIAEEAGEPVTVKKKPGRPRGSTSKKTSAKKKKEQTLDDDPVAREAAGLEGTPPDIAARLSKRKFTPIARPMQGYGPGVHPGVGGPSSPGVGDDEPISR